MDTNAILTELRAERARIEQAIAALQALETKRGGRGRGAGAARGRRGRLSAEARRRIATAMKARWAERKSASSQPKIASKRGRLTAAGRKRLSEMMKKRWAERRKQQKQQKSSQAS
jgi:hypothetical protein